MKFVLFFILLSVLFSKPIHLLAPDKNHEKIIVSPEAMKFLETLNSPVSVVSIVGPLHSGKSFLTNQLLGENSFELGYYVAPKTQGLWMDVVKKDNRTIIFLDSEGLFASNVSEIYDAKIFSICSLISSYMIYNTVRIIDESSIDYIELLSRRAQLFSYKTQMEYMDTQEPFVFPPLLWVVQSFFQDTLQKTPKEWLSSLLEARPKGKSNTMKDLYKEIDCETLFIPHKSKSSLKALDKVAYQDLNPLYRQELERIREKVHKAPPKKSFNREISGAELAKFIQVIVKSANANEFPVMPSVWDGFVKLTANEAIEEAWKFYVNSFGSEVEDNVFSSKKINEIAKEIREKAISIFSTFTFGIDSLPERATLEEKLRDKEHQFLLKNDDKISEFCQKQRMRAKAWLSENISHISLPMKSEDLELIIKEQIETTLQQYSSAVEFLNEESDVLSNKKSLISEMNGEIAGMKTENYDKIRDLFMHAKKEASKGFNEFLGQYKYQALSVADLQKAFEEGVAKSKQILEASIGQYMNE